MMRNDRERSSRTEDLDLVDVMVGLWHQKALVLSIALLSTLPAVLYVFLAKPIFEARLHVVPPAPSDIAELNYGRERTSELEPYTVKQVYDVYAQRLQSESLRRDFFEQVYLPTLNASSTPGDSDNEALYTSFSNAVQVQPFSDANGEHLYLSFRDNDPTNAAKWATAYAERAGQTARQEVLLNVARDAQVKALGVEQQISAARDNAKQIRDDKILQLREALAVANELGLERPPTSANLRNGQADARKDSELTYLRGARALRAEIGALQRRTSEDPFIGNLRELQVKQRFYEDVAAHEPDIKVYEVDGAVTIPNAPIKPRKAMAIGLALLVGTFAGTLVALACYLVRRYRRERVKPRLLS